MQLNCNINLHNFRNGCVDSPFQSMTAMFMALGKKDVSKIVTGPLTPSM